MADYTNVNNCFIFKEGKKQDSSQATLNSSDKIQTIFFCKLNLKFSEKNWQLSGQKIAQCSPNMK